ncbi:MAG: DNA polymerase III subunit beta [Patescibacteria group bacterium]
MKLSATRENLYQGLAITSHISTKNVNLPILSNVLMQADKGGLKLISTNLEITITCNIRGKVEQEGEYTIPSKLFFDYVSLLPNERIDADLHDDALSIVCGDAKTKIKGIVASEFPLVPPVKSDLTYSVSVNELKTALSRVLFAAATNEARPELAGVLLAFNHPTSGAGTLTLAATDSYRLAEAVVKLSSGGGEVRQMIVPQRTLSEWNRILGVFKDDVEAPVAVEIGLSGNQIVLRYGGVELSSSIIEKNYPDYKQIIPKTVKTEIVIDRQEFIQAIKAASLFSKTGLYDVGLKATTGGLELSALDAARGENKVLLASEMTGDENLITLNFRFLLDGVNAMDSAKVRLKMIDGANPCIVVPEGATDEKYQYIVMPIRQ